MMLLPIDLRAFAEVESFSGFCLWLRNRFPDLYAKCWIQRAKKQINLWGRWVRVRWQDGLFLVEYGVGSESHRLPECRSVNPWDLKDMLLGVGRYCGAEGNIQEASGPVD